MERDGAGSYRITALASPSAAWLNGRQLEPRQPATINPGDELELGARGHPDTTFRVKMVHASVWRQLGAGAGSGGPMAGPAGGNGAGKGSGNGVHAGNGVSSSPVGRASAVAEPSLV